MAISGGLALGLGSIVSGLFGARSASRAADAQAQAAREATELQREIYYDQRDLTAPYRDTGVNALAAMAYEMGIGPRPTFGGTAPNAANGQPLSITETLGAETRTWQPPAWIALGKDEGDSQGQWITSAGPSTFSVGDRTFETRDEAQSYLDSLATPGTEYGGFKASPGFEFVRDQGEQGLERQLAARGMRLGGPAAKEAMRFNSGLASQEYGNFYNRLTGLSGTGQSAVSQQIGAGTNFANLAGNNLRAAGDARASGYLGVNNAFQGTFNNLASIYGMNQAGAFAPAPAAYVPSGIGTGGLY